MAARARCGPLLLLALVLAMATTRCAAGGGAPLPYSQGGAYVVDAGVPAGVSARYVDAGGGSDTNDVRERTLAALLLLK